MYELVFFFVPSLTTDGDSFADRPSCVFTLLRSFHLYIYTLSSDRDGGKSKVIPEEVEKRRAIFWEIMYLDARLVRLLLSSASKCLSLHTSTPESLSREAALTPPFPYGLPTTMLSALRNTQQPREPTLLYACLFLSIHGDIFKSLSLTDQEWKHSCLIHCLNPMLELTSSPTLDYATVIELDNKIRNFSIPSIFQNSETTFSRPLTMQKASLSTALEAGSGTALHFYRTTKC